MTSTLEEFRLERYFGRHEFSCKYLLSSSDCDTVPMSTLLAAADEECLGLWSSLTLGYTETQGLPLLRQEIASHLYAGALEADDIVVAAPGELILVAMHALLTQGDEVVVLCPTYQSLHSVARSLGCTVRPWYLRHAVCPRSGEPTWDADLDELRSLLTATTKMLVVNIPNNPTGFTPTRETMKAIVDLLMEVSPNAILFSDEMYRFLIHDDGFPAPPTAVALHGSKNIVVLSGLSKSYGLPGLRIGWLGTRNKAFVQRFLAMKDYTTICNAAPSEILAVIALRCASTVLLPRSIETVRRNLAVVRRFCAEFSTYFAFIKGGGGSVVFLQWVHPTKRLDDVCDEALNRFEVMLVRGSLFDENCAAFVRIGLGRASLEGGLLVLARLLTSLS